ncbi:hypothetical protein BY996DRAFT_6731473 [Phakopsora pachyrhizi]|nr:hypothetical protein BY996DRAFT_6731473 [Phakopsora pachyrhizi]
MGPRGGSRRVVERRKVKLIRREHSLIGSRSLMVRDQRDKKGESFCLHNHHHFFYVSSDCSSISDLLRSLISSNLLPCSTFCFISFFLGCCTCVNYLIKRSIFFKKPSPPLLFFNEFYSLHYQGIEDNGNTDLQIFNPLFFTLMLKLIII